MSLWRRFITWLLWRPFRGEFERECAKWREFDREWRPEMEKHWEEYLEGKR
jgi:hypothetical protein